MDDLGRKRTIFGKHPNGVTPPTSIYIETKNTRKNHRPFLPSNLQFSTSKATTWRVKPPSRISCSSLLAPPGGPSIQVLSCDSNFIIGDLEFEVLVVWRVWAWEGTKKTDWMWKTGGKYVLKTHIYWFYCDIQAFVIEYAYLTISYTTSCGTFTI